MKHLLSNHNETTLGPLFDLASKLTYEEIKNLPHKPIPVSEIVSRMTASQVPDGNDSTTGQQLKEKGIKSVSEHNENWMANAIMTAKRFVYYQGLTGTFIGEDIRLACQWMPQPKHPNAWGALINTLVKRKIIVPTGEYRQPKDKNSHARAIQVYKFNG